MVTAFHSASIAILNIADQEAQILLSDKKYDGRLKYFLIS